MRLSWPVPLLSVPHRILAHEDVIAHRASQAQQDALLKVSSLQINHRATGSVPAEYVVQRGDTLFSIARRFGVNHNDIQRWNDSRQLTRLQPGQKVRIQGL